jgi:hypothetical protein
VTIEYVEGRQAVAESGKELGVDLYRLWWVGSFSLPAVASVYAHAHGRVEATDYGLAPAFRRPPQFGGSQGPVFDPWLEMRRILLRILEETADNLECTGAALVMAADVYASTDQAAADELNRRQNELRNG